MLVGVHDARAEALPAPLPSDAAESRYELLAIDAVARDRSFVDAMRGEVVDASGIEDAELPAHAHNAADDPPAYRNDAVTIVQKPFDALEASTGRLLENPRGVPDPRAAAGDRR
jgi:hypothetical protein